MADQQDIREQYIDAVVKAKEAQDAYDAKVDEWFEKAKPEIEPLHNAFKEAYQHADRLAVELGKLVTDQETSREIALEVARRVGMDEDKMAQFVAAFFARQRLFALMRGEQTESQPVLN